MTETKESLTSLRSAIATISSNTASASSSSSKPSPTDESILAAIQQLTVTQQQLLTTVNSSIFDMFTWSNIEEKLLRLSKLLSKTAERIQEKLPVLLAFVEEKVELVWKELKEWTKDIPAQSEVVLKWLQHEGVKHLQVVHDRLNSVLLVQHKQYQLPGTADHVSLLSYGLIGTVAFFAFLLVLRIVLGLIRGILCCGWCRSSKKSMKSSGSGSGSGVSSAVGGSISASAAATAAQKAKQTKPAVNGRTL